MNKTDANAHPPRPYKMGKREATTAQTRERILAAARDLILGPDPLTKFSMELVARQAGITRVTIYHHFGSKSGVMEALLDEIAFGAHISGRLTQAFEMQGQTEILRETCRAFCELYAQNRIMMRRLRAFGDLDEEFGQTIAGRDRRRSRNMNQLLRLLDAHLPQVPDLTPEAAHDKRHRVLMGLTNFSFYDVVAQGRDQEEIVETLFRLVAAALELAI